MKKAGAANNQMFPELKVSLRGCQNDPFWQAISFRLWRSDKVYISRIIYPTS